MSHLKSRLPQIGRECGSLKAYEDVFRYKIVCILQCLLGMRFLICILCGKDFLALGTRRKIRQQRCHADVPAQRRIVLFCIAVEAAGMCAIDIENHGHCERRDCGNSRAR